jgi:hypothetical protein
MALAAQAVVASMCDAVSAVAARIWVILAPALGNNAVINKDCSIPFGGMAEHAAGCLSGGFAAHSSFSAYSE